jgi:hypothetical protein
MRRNRRRVPRRRVLELRWSRTNAASRAQARGRDPHERRGNCTVNTHTIIVICAPLLFLVAFSMGRESIRLQRRRTWGVYLRPTYTHSPGIQYPPRGGGSNQHASPTPRAATTREPSATAATASSSSSLVPGHRSVVWEAPRMLRDPSRLTGRGWSTLGTATPGANGLQHEDAA